MHPSRSAQKSTRTPSSSAARRPAAEPRFARLAAPRPTTYGSDVPYAFTCTACEVVLDDGVDYMWCPKCGGAVQPIAPAAPVKRAPLPSVGVVSRRLLAAFLILQAIFAL